MAKARIYDFATGVGGLLVAICLSACGGAATCSEESANPDGVGTTPSSVDLDGVGTTPSSVDLDGVGTTPSSANLDGVGTTPSLDTHGNRSVGCPALNQRAVSQSLSFDKIEISGFDHQAQND